MMQAKTSSEKSALFYRTSRRQISQLTTLFKSSSRNYFTLFYKNLKRPQPQDFAAASRSMHPVLSTLYIQSTCFFVHSNMRPH